MTMRSSGICKYVLVSILLSLTACAAPKKEDLKSPCVGAQGSPCERRPVNDWWMT